MPLAPHLILSHKDVERASVLASVIRKCPNEEISLVPAKNVSALSNYLCTCMGLRDGISITLSLFVY